MIDILTNGFLTNPVPVQFTGNYCSHGCVYCFANINNPKRKLDVKAVLSQIKNYHKRNDLASYYMREKYPMLLSNNIDPFSKSNQPFVNELIYTLKDLGIPVVLATRGGIGWQEIAKEIKPSVWYVSIPYENDDIRKQYEPKAPSIEERWELIKEVTSQGHKVILSINPFNPKFNSKPIETAERAKELGVKSLLINKLHLKPKQQSNLTQREKDMIGDDLLIESRKRGFTPEWLEMAIELYDWCQINDMTLLGMEPGLFNNNFQEFKECYDNLLPTIDDFFNWAFLNKETGDQITFDEFFNFFSERLPDIEGNISKYIFNRAVISEKEFYKKMNLKNLLHLYWQHPKVNIGLAKHFPAFSWAKKQYPNKLDFIYDDQHNQILHYNGFEFEPKESVILN